MEGNLADPYELRSYGSNEQFYLGMHDFNKDGVPELIIGDNVSAAVFTYENGWTKKNADLYEPEFWGGINGLYYKDNHIVLVSSGSDGSGYVCFTYCGGEYITGVYDDYNQDTATVNGKRLSGEEFRQQFNLTDLPENSRVSCCQVKRGNRKNLLTDNVMPCGWIIDIKDESCTLDKLDFRILMW